jgi:protein-S-isoprenylcysteine O-methyltransferase Ste14
MSVLRILLFAGLLLRRLNLEVLKRAGTRPETRTRRVSLAKLVKGGVQLFLGVQTLFLTILPISAEPGLLRAVGTVLFVLALVLTMVSRRQLGKSWVDLEEARILPEHRLVSHGVYRYVRHPIYTADLLLFVGLQLALNSWLVLGALVLLPVLFWRTSREERQLADAFPGYAEYRKRTKRFVPFVV